MANGDIPAGWYPEPSGAGGERWWDGYQWTQHVRGGAAAAEPAAQAQQRSASQVPAGWYPDPSGGGGQRYWDGAQWTEHVSPAQGAASAAGSGVTDPGASATAGVGDPADVGETAAVGDSAAAGGGDASAQQGSASQVPAGWYPDPSGGGGQRYWDGAQWTEHVEPAATASGPASSEEARGDGAGAELAGDGSTSATAVGAEGEPVDGVEGEPSAGVEGEPAEGEVVAQDANDAGDVHASTAAATASPEIPAGWYPDPAGGSGQRWWDGTRWTDHVQDGSSGGEVGGGAADAASSAGSVDDPAGVTTDAAGSDGGAQRTEAVDLDPADVDEPADPTEPDTGVSSDDGLGVAPSDGTGDGSEADEPADDAGVAALGGAGAVGAAGVVGASEVGEDATPGDSPVDGDVAADGDVADGGDTPLDGDDAVDEPRDDVGYEDAELTQPLATEDVGQAATEDVGQAATEDVGQAATEDAAATSAVIPPGWYADPSGVGERWWSGDAWTEHVRSTGPSGVTGGDQTSTGPMDQAQETQVMGATGHEAGQPGGSPADQGGFTMTGVGDLPPTGPPPEGDDDDGGGGSGKLILAIVLIVVLLAAIGAGLWFFTDVFDAEGEPATAVAEENEELPEEQPEAEEPEPEPTFGHVRDVDYAEVEWSTTCVGSEGNGGSRPAQPQSISFGSPAGDSLVHPNPHDASGLPAFEVELGTVQYGDVTGDGGDDAVFLTYCDDATATDTGFAVWSLDEEGQPLQQPSPPIELTVGAFELDSFEVGDGRLVVTTQEVQPDGSALEVVTAYVFAGGSWSADEIEREEPPAAVEDDRIPGIDHLEFSDEWSFEARVTAQAPLIATHEELPSTFIIALDESLLGFAGPDLDFDDLVDEWVEVLEAVADEEEVTLEDDWFTEVDIDGAERAVMLLYEGETAEINYYALIVEVGDLVVEVSVQMGHEGWLEEDQLRDDAIELFGSFTFDADALMEAYGQG